MTKRLGLLTRLLAYGCLLAASARTFAGLDQWTAQPTYGAVVQAIAIETPSGTDPATTLYVGTAGSGVFKSTDGGTRWVAKNNGLDVLDVQALTIDPTDATIIYAGTATGGIFRSADAGESWAAINGTADAPLKNLNVYAIGIHPSDHTKLYAATFGNLFQSLDSGQTWEPIGVPIGESLNLIDNATYTVALPRDVADILYVGSHSNGVFKSNVGVWTNPWPSSFGTTPKIVRSIRALTISADGSVIYAATQCLDADNANCAAGVAVSSNSGATWAAAANNGLTTKTVRALAMPPDDTSVLYAGATTGFFYSIDGGNNWAESTTEMDVLSIAIDPNDATKVYAGTTEGLYVSVNGGQTFTPSNAGIVNFTISDIAVHPANPLLQYAATTRGGVIKTTDGGGTWSYVNTGLSYRETTAIAMDTATSSETVYVGTNRGGVLKSINGGATWASIDAGLSTRRITKLVADPNTPGRLYAGASTGVLVTDDAGASWSSRNTGLCPGPDVSPPPRCPEEVKALAVDPTDATTVYVSTSAAGIYKGTWVDGDITWAPITLGLTNDFVSAIAVDPTNSNNLYVGTLGGGVFASTDGGESWSAAESGLPDDFITALVIEPNAPTILYAATASSGVFKSTTSAATWTAINTDLDNLAVKSLAINATTTTPTLYAGTDGSGIYEIQSTAASAAPSPRTPASASTNGGGGGGTADVLWILGLAALTGLGRRRPA